MVIIIIIIFLILFLLTYNHNNIKTENFSLDKLKQYLINLDHRKDRFDITNNLLYQYDFKNVIRYPAVNGKNMTNDELVKIVDPVAMKSILDNYRKDHHELSYGAVGCYLSHINIWQKLKADNLDYIIIFEDDAKPSFSFTELQEIIENNVPNDWDIILFGGIYNKTNNINDNITKIYTFYEMHAYIINKKGAIKLLSQAFPITKQLDSWLSDLAINNYVNIYGITKNKWGQNSQISNTDIQTEIK
jgi:GR25 family glycosyltransferase involved in LPS biosynthesis